MTAGTDNRTYQQPPKILIFNWQEEFTRLLSGTGFHFDVVDVRNREKSGFEGEGPILPSNCGLISNTDAKAALTSGIYDRVVCQNISDLEFTDQYNLPKIMFIQNGLSFLVRQYTEDLKENITKQLRHRIESAGDITLVYDSPDITEDWGYEGEIILPGIDCGEYEDYAGNIERVLRRHSNNAAMSEKYVREKLLLDVPSTLVGDNNKNSTAAYIPLRPEEYKSLMRSHRLYLNTSADGRGKYAVLEAMASGMPVVSVMNPHIPVIDSVSGYMSNDTAYLRRTMKELMEDRSLAESIGEKGRNAVGRFPVNIFIDNWRRVLKGPESPGSDAGLRFGRYEKESGQNTGRTFEYNLSVLAKRNPSLARAVKNTRIGMSLNVVNTRSGLPSLRVNNITLHSMYDPVKEACSWVDHQLEKVNTSSSICVFGFGLGYHIVELCRRTDRKITVFERRLDVLKAALEHTDLVSTLSRVRIMNDTGALQMSDAAILAHRPSVDLEQEFFDVVQKKLRSYALVNRGMKILVVSPIYGGSLPVAGYCSSSLIKMGHTVEFMDNSRFHEDLFLAKGIADKGERYDTMIDLLTSFISEMVMARCEDFKPDLVLALAQAPLNCESLKKLGQMGVKTAYWFVEDFRIMDYWRKIAPYYDFFFTIQKDKFFDELKEAGIRNYHYLPMAASPEVHQQLKLSAEDKNHYGSELSFVGAGYYNRRHFLKGLIDFDMKIWGTDWDMHSALAPHIQRPGAWIDTGETVKIFNASAINLNLHSSTYHKGINPFGDFVNPRTFEIPCCGGFQLLDRRSVLDELFEVGEEIIVFDDLNDLRTKATFYLNNPEERERIVQKGRKRIVKDHTYEKRMGEMLKVVGEYGIEPSFWKEDGEELESLIAAAGEGTELQEYLSRFSERKSIDLADIAEEIAKGEGDISKTEKLFLMMNAFVR